MAQGRRDHDAPDGSTVATHMSDRRVATTRGCRLNARAGDARGRWSACQPGGTCCRHWTPMATPRDPARTEPSATTLCPKCVAVRPGPIPTVPSTPWRRRRRASLGSREDEALRQAIDSGSGETFGRSDRWRTTWTKEGERSLDGPQLPTPGRQLAFSVGAGNRRAFFSLHRGGSGRPGASPAVTRQGSPASLLDRLLGRRPG